MLSGKTPFTGKTLQEILAKHLNELPPSVVQSNPDLRVPVDLDEFLRRALEKDRGKRFQTADSMLNALKEVRLDGELAKPAPRPAPAADLARRRKRLPLLLGGVALIALIALGAAFGGRFLGGGTEANSGPPPARLRLKTGGYSPAESNYLAKLDSAKADMLAGDTAAAFSSVQEALRSEVADAEGYFVRGLVYRERNDPDTARMDFEEALRIDPGYGDAAAQLGWMALEAGDREAALEAFTEASRIDARSAEALAGQGAVRLLEGRPQDAERLLNEALAIDPELVAAHLYLGRACLELGKPQEAVDAFVRAKRSAPGSWEAYAGLGEAYLALDRWQEAKQQLEEAIDLEPDAVEPRLHYARMLVDREQYTEAQSQLVTAVEKSGDDPQLQVLLGVTLAEEFPPGAANALRKAVELGATDANVRTLLGSVYLEAGKPEEALVQIDAALAADDTNALAHLDRGLALMQVGRYQEAAAPLERAAELEPSDPFPHLVLGALYMEFIGDSGKATEHLRKYGDLGGEDPRASQWLRQRVR
jgi:tetratricopeptide (TPR) repeat protein